MEQTVDNTAIQASEPRDLTNRILRREAQAESATTWPERWQQTAIYKVLRVVASLRVTVVLFAFSMALVFWGTLAQVDFGIQTVMQKYFRSLYVWVPAKYVLCLPFLKLDAIPFSIPYPGGWLLGGLLMTNLVAAHIVRFKTHWTQIGIWLIHIGIAVMMIGEFFTGLYAVEGNMTIRTGQSSNFLELRHAPELAFVHTLNGQEDSVVVIPGSRLKKAARIADPQLPCDVVIEKYMVNSKLEDLVGGEDNLADKGWAKREDAKAIELPEGTGVDSDQRIDVPSIYATFKKDGKSLGTFLLSPFVPEPDWIRIDGKDYQVSLRFQRKYCNYRIHLTKFDHEFHPGGQKQKEFRSTIDLVDLSTDNEKLKDNRKNVTISMNAPLRYRGETFYQSGTVPDKSGKSIGTVLQVVRNPAWTLPYWSCGLVAVGMLFHFLLTLTRFIQRSAVYAK
jgi:hypothetical protein